MKRTCMFVILFLLVATTVAARTVKKVLLEEGRKDDNTLTQPVIVPSAPLEISDFTQGFPGNKQLNRKASGAVMGAKAKCSPDVDLGVLLGLALRNEAPPMGFELGPGGWELAGTLSDLFYDVRSNGWAVFFYGTVIVELEITSPDGEIFRETLRLYNYDPEFSKKHRAVVAEMLVEGAQEILARLNLRYFKFPADPSVERMLKEIAGSPDGVDDKDLECASIGLSGSSAVVMPLLSVLERTEDENDRCEIIDALARLADARAIPVLKARYSNEDEDVRWQTLKAMAYIGSDEALALVKEKGVSDKNKACRALALDILQ